MNISNIDAIEIVDSRGNPTVRAFVTLSDGSVHSASVPSGASTGAHEALELRDQDPKRFHGKGVQKAVENIKKHIAKELVGNDVNDPKKLDEVMLALDGTENKSKLGANAILGVSMAVHRAAAHVQHLSLWQFLQTYYFKGTGQNPSFPRIMVNVVNGGKHAGWTFDIQEFMIVPRSDSPSEAVRLAAETFAQMKTYLKKHKLSTLVGDEGGLSPALKSNEEVYELIIASAKTCGYENTKDYDLALDAAASEFFHENTYLMHGLPQQFVEAQKIKDEDDEYRLSAKMLNEYYQMLHQHFSIYSFEDPFAEDDWNGFAMITKALGDRCLIVGDDNYVTNTKRIQKGIDQQTTNAVLIKLNQIGSVAETIDAIQMTHKAGWKTVISHRSGETSDAFIADLACASGAGFIKTGSMSRSERLVKYNRLIEIENGM
ncbi:phosphopyruvate hydratase [Candidatus Woesebacteria bacterium]|nr:phosphopyruvate hydratase [Candidatus Woesebacteria bacterium]